MYNNKRNLHPNSYRLKVSNAILGEDGMAHLGVADWVGQNPVVKTRTNISTPCKLACKESAKEMNILKNYAKLEFISLQNYFFGINMENANIKLIYNNTKFNTWLWQKDAWYDPLC